MRKFNFERMSACNRRLARQVISGWASASGRKNRRPSLAHQENQQWRTQTGRWRRSGRHDSLRPAHPGYAETELGHDFHALFQRAGHLTGGLHGSHFHRQGHGCQNQGSHRPQSGTDRPGSGQLVGSFSQAYPGLRLILALGGQPQFRRKNRHVVGVYRADRAGRPAVPDPAALSPAAGSAGRQSS